jgi:transcriptional regulator with XRE-family HTH domain
MSQYTEHVGERIRMYRKVAGYSLEQLSEVLHKSRSTVSKYELGQISIDIDTLSEIANVLHVSIHSLTDFSEPELAPPPNAASFFADGLLYAYWLNGHGKQGKLQHGVLEIRNAGRTVNFYLQFPDFKRYQECKVICSGDITVTDQLTTINLQNYCCASDHVFICAYTPLNNRQTETLCQYSTITTPAAPVTVKLLLSKHIRKENEDLFLCLQISRDEIAFLRRENRFRVSPLPFT